MSDTEKETKEIVEDCSNSDVVTKYRLAADIVNTALKGVIAQITPEKSVAEVCEFGDTLINQCCANIYKSKKIEKGVAFPTCISVNEIVCHNSPLGGESTVIKEGDWIKIDLGCHIDGYIALGAHTVIVSAEGAETPVELTGVDADVMKAASTAVEVCTKLIKPGNKNTQVTAALEQVAEAYGVKSVQGTLMHQMKRFIIDGSKVIASKVDVEKKVEEVEFEPNEVYTIDICFTTGEDKPHESESRTTVFKRIVDKSYRLKMKSSRYVFNEINNRFPTLPFTVRAFEDERQARMGVVECLKHELLQAFPVMHTRAGDRMVHLKCTVLLLPSGTTKITGLSLPEESMRSDKTVSDEITAILASSTKNKKKKNKKKKAATTGDAEVEEKKSE